MGDFGLSGIMKAGVESTQRIKMRNACLKTDRFIHRGKVSVQFLDCNFCVWLLLNTNQNSSRFQSLEVDDELLRWSARNLVIIEQKSRICST